MPALWKVFKTSVALARLVVGMSLKKEQDITQARGNAREEKNLTIKTNKQKKCLPFLSLHYPTLHNILLILLVGKLSTCFSWNSYDTPRKLMSSNPLISSTRLHLT